MHEQPRMHAFCSELYPTRERRTSAAAAHFMRLGDVFAMTPRRSRSLLQALPSESQKREVQNAKRLQQSSREKRLPSSLLLSSVGPKPLLARHDVYARLSSIRVPTPSTTYLLRTPNPRRHDQNADLRRPRRRLRAVYINPSELRGGSPACPAYPTASAHHMARRAKGLTTHVKARRSYGMRGGFGVAGAETFRAR
ncbi:hypothetical protein BV20DRAFT_348095 [Pilatotrama ljubarskyi]|nr:hypothetical protein BV20DRAFT_348095 [Pilatotrama ljubarskyi]